MRAHVFLKFFPALLSWPQLSLGCIFPQGLSPSISSSSSTSTLPDSSFSSSVKGSHPEAGRLHNEANSWCFSSRSLEQSGAQAAELEIALPGPVLLSGIQSQGPPRALHPKSYMRYIAFTVDIWQPSAVSGDGHWHDCCSGDGGGSHFYADDTSDELGEVTTHSFGRLVVATKVKIRVSTSLRWIGHDLKCFRFELLGCHHKSGGRSDLRAIAKPAGYLSVDWLQPKVTLPGEEDHQLESSHFLLKVEHKEDKEVVVEVHNTSDHSLLIPSPFWGAAYTFSLTCWLANQPLPCGEQTLVARPNVSLACTSQPSFCSQQEQVLTNDQVSLLSTDEMFKVRFMTSTNLSATVKGSSLFLSWKVALKYETQNIRESLKFPQEDFRVGWKVKSWQVRLEEQHWAGRLFSSIFIMFSLFLAGCCMSSWWISRWTEA